MSHSRTVFSEESFGGSRCLGGWDVGAEEDRNQVAYRAMRLAEIIGTIRDTGAPFGCNCLMCLVGLQRLVWRPRDYSF